MLIGNQNVINKSCGFFYGAPVTTGSATTGVQFSRGLGSLNKSSFSKLAYFISTTTLQSQMATTSAKRCFRP